MASPPKFLSALAPLELLLASGSWQVWPLSVEPGGCTPYGASRPTPSLVPLHGPGRPKWVAIVSLGWGYSLVECILTWHWSPRLSSSSPCFLPHKVLTCTASHSTAPTRFRSSLSFASLLCYRCALQRCTRCDPLHGLSCRFVFLTLCPHHTDWILSPSFSAGSRE
jgi:hypothetical protein